MADQTVLEQSLESQIVDEPFVSRQSVYVIDSNNGAYNGQIQIDTSSLSNSGRWASYSEGVLQIPLVVTMEALGTTDATAVTSSSPIIKAGKVDAIRNLRKQFAVGLKNGYYQLIHSLSVEYNNTSVVQLTPYLNHYVNYKLLTTLSADDVTKWGTSIGFYPDGYEGHDYDNSTTVLNPDGRGSMNNRNLRFSSANEIESYKVGDISATDTNNSHINEGFRSRTMKCTGVNPLDYTTSTLLSEDNVTSLARNYYKRAALQASNSTNAWTDTFFVLAQIRLKDICDFFDKLPLTRGAYMRLLINTNTSEHKIGYIAQKPAANQVFATYQINNLSTTVTGGTSPLLVASANRESYGDQSQGGNFLRTMGSNVVAYTDQVEFDFTVRSSIVKDTTLGISHPIPNCRLYVPLYTMTNEEVKRYLTLQPTKHIVYRDIFQYQFDVEAGATFNQLLTNGVANPKTLILIPYINSKDNPTSVTGALAGGSGTTTLGNYLPPYQSPFASEPGTTSPYVGIRDYNVQLAGVNVYTSNTLYDFEAFRNELARINGINGGVVDGLMSGLIGQEQFEVNNRYYVTDLSRRIKAEDAVPKSIQVSGTNASQVRLTIFCFLEMEKSCDVALDSGLLLG